MLSLETSLLSETENSTKKFTSTKTATTIPDCDLSNVTITEVYHYSSDWIEIYNDGNQTCDLGEWRIGDSGSSFEIANNTNISANQHLVFTSSNSGLNFDISCNDQIFISTRNVDYVNATEITQLDCYGPNDNDYYNTNLDGSWELCDGFWDWNEPDEMTQNSTNLCNGNPFSFNSLSEDGTWDNNPSSIDNGSSTLSWNVSNLDENTEYQLYSSWNTGLNSFSRNYYFNGGIEDITFDMFSSIDWTCEVNIYAYLRNQSSSIIEEYFGKDFDVSNCPSTGFTFDFQGSTGIQNGHNFSAGIGSFTAKAIQISSDQEYIVEIKLNQDNIVTDSFTEECDYIIGTSNTQCQALGQNIFIYDETCDVEFSVMIYTKSPYGWIEIGSESIEGVGPCNSDSNDISEPIRLYANMTDSNGTYSYQVVDSGNSVLNTSTTNTHNFYWAFPTSSYGSEYRFYSYYDNDQVFDFQSFIIGEDTLSDYDNVPSIGDGTTFLHLLPWNATSSGGDCTPYIYSYLYLISPDGEQYHVDQWSQSMDLSDCTTTEVDILIDWNNSVSQDSWTTDTDSNDLLNGTNSMYLNISNLEVGQEYVLEWYSYRSSSYTNNDGSIYGEYHNTTTFTSSSENESIAWTIDVPGSWCDLDIYYTLYSPRVSQEWHTLEDEGRYDNIISSNYDFDPVCDGTDIPEYNPVSLMYNDSGTWIEVNESTNLSVGIYDMKWQVSGISDSANVRLYTTYEQYLNSSTQSYNYYKEGNFEENWELIISDWSCNIDFDFDLNLVLLHSGSQRDMDYSKNNPFIDGPCNTPIDVSSSNSNEPSYSISKLVENSTQNLDSGTGSLDEGENTIRWSIENTVDDYEHYLHMSLRYNNQIDEFIFENFLGDGGEISGDWSFELEGDVCDIQIYTELYVKEYNGMDSIDSSNYYLSYSGNSSDCDYQDNNIGFSVLDDSNTWNSSLETLSTGTNQMRFNMDFDYVEDVTYYISAYVDAPGSQQESWNGYFSIGQPTSSSSSWDDYFGEDIYLNFTVNAWACSVTAYAYIYYITPTNSWQQFKRMNTVFDVEHCESAGEISVSSFVNNQWNDQLDNNYELETGQNDFYWNMTNLSLDENYQMYFYAYKDNIQIYNYVRDYWVADSTSESWHFPVNIESSVCNFYAYAYLYVLVDDSYSQVDYVSFHPQEPCLPDFDINFITDDSSSWLDAQTDVIPVGTTQMMFDLSELGEGDYEIDYYWNSDESYSNWDYDNYFTVDENNSGLFWNITLEALDCSVYLDVRLYDRSYGGNYQIGSYNNILLNGPCLIPFNLDVNGVEYDNQNGNPDLSLGDNDMTWTFDNLDTGINYYLSFYWYNGSYSYSENYYFTYNESNDYAWNLPIGVWDCSPYSYATLYYADNGSHIFGNEYFYFNVPECYNVWLDHTDSDGNYMNSDDLNNGSNDMSWDIYDLPEGYEFALEMRTYMNGYMQEYSYELFNDSGNVSIDFSIDVDTYSTCDVRVEASLLYLDYNGNWDHLEGNSKYFYLNCDSYESMYPWSVFVDADGDGNYSEVSQYDNIGGNGTIPMMLDLSNLADDEIYRVQYRWYTSLDSEYFNWEDVTSTNNQFYFDVPVSNWDCEVRLYVYIQYESIYGYYNHMASTNQYFNTDCLEPGNVSLNMDNMGEVWDDWSNLNNGTNNMSWEMTDLIVGETYTIDWYVKYNNDIVSYEYLTWTTGDSNESISWSFDMDNSTTCNVEIMYRMFVDSGDSDWIEMDNEYFYWYPSCDQWVYPDDNYVNLYVDINGTMVENPDTLPSGEVDFEVHFENMSVGADYRMYFYYSNTGFNSNSQYIYFTYDGSPMEMTIDIAPWACSVYFSYDMRLYDFRYGDGNSYSDWYLGSDSTYIDGPCESLNYDSSNYPDFTITDDAGNDIDDETDFLEGNNTIILGADNLQNSFPYYMELQVRYDGYLNVFKTHSFTGNNTTMEEFHTIIDLPGHVCSVEVRSYLYVTTSSGSNQLNYTNYYADGPCDGSDGESRLDTPLHAYLNGTWVEVDDDTFFPAGETDMSWDLSGLDPDTYYYMDYNAPNTGWGGYFYGDNIPDQLDDWSIMLSEFRCDMHFYRNIYAISDYTGWNSMGSQYFYPDNDCLDGGDITLEIQDDEGNWSSYDSSSSYDLLPGTTNFSWSLDNLLEGYDYEFYWYQQGSEYRSEYQYFTADSTAQESIDFSITIDQYECNVYFYAYLRPMSDYTGNYEETEYFSFHPIEPCYPPFNFAAEDAAGNLTVDALDPDFVLSPGDNHLFFDFNHMDNGTTYYLDWYWSSQNSWNGWYQNYVYVDTTDNISDGLHFNMTLDSMECYAYVYVNVYNYSNGNSYHMGNYNIDLEGPCMVPFSLDVNGVEYDNQNGNPDLSLGDNDMTWTFDNLDTGINYYLSFYWYNGSYSYSENYYFTYNESNDYAWNLPIGVWDCSPYSYATLYYADNGSHIFGNEYFYFNVPECYNVWLDHTDSDGNYMNSDDLNNGSNDMSWDIYDLPEGYEFALEMRTYMNGYMQEYSYELFNDSGNVSIDFSIDVDTYSTCDVRVEASLLYLDYNGNWDHLEGNSKYFYLNCDSYESMYPWSVFVDADGDGNYSEVSQYDNIGGNGTIPMMLDLSNLADDEIYRVQYRWYTSLDSEYFNWEDVTSTNNQFYFDVPVSNWDCEVRLYVYIQYESIYGYYNHMASTNQYFNTDCLEPGNVSLNMDNMGEVWDDWSNLNNGTNNMSWEMTDLIVGETYTIDWYVKYNNDIVSYEYLTWTTGDSNESISWSFDMDNSTTCNVEIMYRMFVDSGDSDWIEMDNEYFYWYPSCDQWVYPDDNYVNLYVDINGTMVENPDTLPSGEVDFEVHFENMSVGADYRMYFYYSNTGFNSNSQYIYFTYDGSPMEMTIDIAPWACSVYFSYDMRLYDFRYGDGNSYSDWYLGSDSTYIDGPCESLNYDSSNYPDFTITDDAGNDIDDETDFLEGNNTIILGADNLQNSFPYYMELQVRYDGYLNVFKTHSFTGNNTTMEEFHTIIDLPGHVCSVEVRSYLYVTTSSGSNQLNYTNYYADGPCDGSDGESRLDTPLHAYLNGTWVEVDDDTFFPAGETDMSWDLSGLDPDTYYYMDYNAPNTGWGGYFYGDNIPDQLDDWSIMLSEFRCDMHFYRNIYAISDYTGWNSMGSQYFYPDNDCLDGGDITLEIQDDEGNWSSYDSSSSYDLLPGTTNFSWSLDNLLEGYDYEFYWYQQGSEYRSEYQYFTADSTAQESIDFSITIDQYECNVYFYAYLRPMSDYTGNYEETEYFSFHPIEPCYPPFNFAAEDAAGNLTVDALDPDFVLSPGDNHLFFDFNHMDNGTTYYLDWYWSSQNSWNGWYQNYVYVDTTDNISDGLHFNMTLDSMECYAYVYVNVYNYSNGNSYHMGNYNIDLEGPCMVPFSLENYEDEPIVDIGENQFTWVIDNLDVGSNYTLQYYYSMNSGFYGWHNYDFTFNGTDFIDFTVNVTEWDCNVNFNANMYNTTNGSMTNLYGNNWNFYNPNCYEVDYYALDSDGDWIQYNDIDAGTTELFWEINYFNGNVPEGYEFELEYQIIIDNDWSNPAQYSVTWIQDDDTTEQLPWNITINDFVCNVYVSSNLHVNTSSGWSSVRGNGFSLYGPCESMPSGWYNFSMNDNGTWTDVHEGWNNMIEDEGDYEMRLELSDLEVGIWYEMSVKAFMYGNLLYDESLFWPVQDNSTVIIDINMSIPHWYCGITFETQLSFEHEEEMFEIMTREYYEEGPCHTNIQDFTESFDVNLELLLINDNLYSQDYEYVIPFTYNLNDNFKLYLDANYGNMDGILNESEAIMAEDAYNSNSLSVEEDAPEFYLNEELFESYRYNNPILSNLSGTPIVTGSWILEYFNIQGVEISTSITDIEIDDLVPWHFSLLESSDILVQSIEVNDSENGSYEQSTQFDLLAGNYSINITWLLANIPDPILELEQYDLVSEEFGELTDVMEDSFNETMTVHTFQISLTNLSYQEYLVAYDVNIDEYYNYNSSYDINREVSNDITTFSVSTDIHTCDVSISIEIYDRNEEHLLTQNYTLEGTCQPYDIDMDGISDEDDAFPYDPTEWLDTDGDGVGDNSDAFPNDPTEWLDSDGDGLGNNNDTDDDNDGIDDDLDNDGDGDGVNNEDDAFPDDPDEWNDTDGDGYGDNSDVFPNNSTEWEDTDGDGIGDNSDDDADGDGVPNDEDGLPLNPNESSDSDNDGIGNNQDAFPNDANEQYDTDSDGIGDNSDTDDDNDGVEDIADAFPLDPNESLDTDGDGAGDNSDVFPNDASEKLDSDGDGVGDNSDMFPSNTDEWSDTDGDGVGDNSDAFPIDSNEQLDSDGDGVGDNSDAFPYDNNEQEDSDGDGVGDNADALPNDSGENADSDGDGVGDNSDAFPNDSSEDTDSDGDGVGDNSDEYPDDPFRTEAEADGGFLPGFSSIMGIISMLGAAIILTGRRKE